MTGPTPRRAGGDGTGPSSLALILLVGAALRLVWALLIPVVPVSDSIAYDTFARTLADHGVYGWSATQPSAYWPVGTSAVVAATYMALGKTYLGVVGLNLVAGIATIYFVFRLGEIYFGHLAGLCAAAVVALWPNLIMFTSVLSSELYFIALTIGGLFFWERRHGTSWLNLLICAALWGAACYVRPVVLLLPVALVLSSAREGWCKVAVAVAKTGAVIAIILVLLAPWTYRNYLVLGEPVLVSTNFGPNLWMGNNPDSTGGYMELPASVHGLSETERAHVLGQQARDFILNDPLRFVVRTLRKAIWLHDRESIGVAWNEAAITAAFGEQGPMALKLVATGYWYFTLAAALAGLWLLVRDLGFWAALLHPALIGWAYFTALFAVIVVEDRYHMPSTPFVALLAGIAVAHLVRYRKGVAPSEV